ncbi:RNA-binding domain-containing protein [Pluteus cervinus]|uniref:RNA-binding domain-containing protein n=1 Tax=Pluteus cervinus TaxID=181527 RepID=A0ACD3B653_9AGAR|nr:RNA-binding domain-containing protein [Pluteus cervinus]
MATSGRPSPDGWAGPVRDTRTQLFVGNLPYRVRWQDLKDLFRKAGIVLRADVSLGPDNRSRGYGTVLLASSEDAQRAVEMFNGYLWQSRTLEVRPDRLPPDFDNPGGNPVAPPGSAGSNTSAFPLPPHMDVHALGLSGPSENLDQLSLYGHPHELGSSSTAACRNLFVGNLPFHCQWQDLKDLFRQAGTILRADVALSQDGRSRGFGTVVFATESDAERAVKMFNGFVFPGTGKRIIIDWTSYHSFQLRVQRTFSQSSL